MHAIENTIRMYTDAAAGQPPQAAASPTGAPAVPISGPQNAAPVGARPRARNPTTGQVIEWDGSAWVTVSGGAPGPNTGAPKPRIGEARDGYTFQGGDPASPQSWAKSGNDPLSQARAAIAQGADPAAVKQRLQQNGIDLSGL